MLDLAKIAGQLPALSNHLATEATASQGRLIKAQELLRAAHDRQSALVEIQKQWQSRLNFTAAIPIEPLLSQIDLPSPNPRHSVFATDGSQIAPSHHEIAYCYLINIGRIMLHYDQNLLPLLDSIPEVFYKAEDLYISRQWGIRTDEWLGYCRTVSELTNLADIACRWVEPPGAHQEPNAALVDGSLIYWFLEGLPTEARDRILTPLLAAWEKLRQAHIPLVGYLSASRSGEATNFLRLQAYPYDSPECSTHCSQEQTPDQEEIEPMRDSLLWGSLLTPGQRGPLFKSTSKILELYGEEHKVYFCYVHVGAEIARLDFPAWVALDAELLEQALGIVLAQVQKGYGYPVALAEAHNQAVVRSGDRARFFALLEQQMVKVGLKNVGVSYKESRKRGSIA
ncbi:MAG: DNA double-strand break repair nuclease NurA [Cyanobacteria bacterium P01_H01_bin.15]